MIALLVTALMIFVIAVALKTGASAQRGSLLTSPAKHLAPFDFPRMLFCLSVILYHCVMIIAPTRSDTRHSFDAQFNASYAFRDDPLYASVTALGQQAVTVSSPCPVSSPLALC